MGTGGGYGTWGQVNIGLRMIKMHSNNPLRFKIRGHRGGTRGHGARLGDTGHGRWTGHGNRWGHDNGAGDWGT